jgi:hypothetical protein
MGLSSRVMVAVALLVLLAGSSVIGASAQREGTFTLSIGAHDCDADPRENSDAICAPNAGTVVTVSLESGEVIGSCTLETSPFPSGGIVSSCGVEGVPFNSTLIIAEDPATLPLGYEPVNSPQTFEVGDVIPGGGDGTVIGFINVLQEGLGGEPPLIYRWTVITKGTCDSMEDWFYPLYPVVMAEGEPVGQSIAIEAETTYRTVDLLLDTLIDEPHLIAVYETMDSSDPVVACGEIGGVNDGDGELVIGLREMNDSGFTGIARLAYNNEDAQKTDVAVYLAQGLADES